MNQFGFGGIVLQAAKGKKQNFKKKSDDFPADHVVNDDLQSNPRGIHGTNGIHFPTYFFEIS